jgi:hypothetical protein
VSGDTQAKAAVLSFEQVVVTPPCEVHAIVAEVADVVAGGCPTSWTVGATVDNEFRNRTRLDSDAGCALWFDWFPTSAASVFCARLV